MSEDADAILQVVDWAGDLLGTLTTVSMGLVRQDAAALYEGAIVGTGVSHMLKSTARLFLNRNMAQREQERVGTVYGLTMLAIKEHLDRGEQPRTDGFFQRDATDRSKAAEIAEGVLISAQREHEEKKIPYLANLLATIAFDPHIDVGMANYMVRIAGSLTYRQYCVVNIAVNVTAWGGIHSPPYNNPENIATQVWALLLEIYDLFRLQNLIGFGGGFFTEVTEMPLERLQLENFGAYLHSAMKLERIPVQDMELVAALVR